MQHLELELELEVGRLGVASRANTDDMKLELDWNAMYWRPAGITQHSTKTWKIKLYSVPSQNFYLAWGSSCSTPAGPDFPVVTS